MNTKTAVGIVIAILILVGAFFFLHRPAVAPVLPQETASTTVPAPTATGTPAAPAAAAAFPAGAVTPKGPAPASAGSAPAVKVVTEQPVLVATIDQKTLATTSAHPTLTGTSNTDKVGIVIDNAAGVGVVGSMDIATANGRWSYTVPLALPSGTYTVHLLGGDAQVDAKLVVSR